MPSDNENEKKNQAAVENEFPSIPIEPARNPIPFAHRYRLVSDRKVLELWFKLAPEVEDVRHLEDRVALALKIDKRRVIRAVKKACLKEMARESRDLILKEVYTDKLPMMKSIVGAGLEHLERFVRVFVPSNIKGAKALKDIVVDLHGMLRLETGQSTQNIDQHITVTKTAEEILKELGEIDPFKDYGPKSE